MTVGASKATRSGGGPALPSGSPVRSSLLQPSMQILGHETEWSIRTSEPDRGKATVVGRGINPAARHAELLSDLVRLEKADEWRRRRSKQLERRVGVADGHAAVHGVGTVTDRRLARPARCRDKRSGVRTGLPRMGEGNHHCPCTAPEVGPCPGASAGPVGRHAAPHGLSRLRAGSLDDAVTTPVSLGG
jgi:hypothetical protein